MSGMEYLHKLGSKEGNRGLYYIKEVRTSENRVKRGNMVDVNVQAVRELGIQGSKWGED